METILRERCNACEPGYAAYCRACMDTVLNQRDEAQRKGGECAKDRAALAEQLVEAQKEVERLRVIRYEAAEVIRLWRGGEMDDAALNLQLGELERALEGGE